MICANRGEPYYMRELKLAGDLGQVLILVSFTFTFTCNNFVFTIATSGKNENSGGTM